MDDDSAFDTTNDSTLDAEMKEIQRKEDERVAEETRLAQAEQMRLMEAQQIEVHYRQEKEEARRQAAAAADRVMLSFNGVFVNKIVFEDDEDEDLTLFADEPYIPFDVRTVYKECAGDLSKIFERLNLNASKSSNQEDDQQESDDEDQDGGDNREEGQDDVEGEEGDEEGENEQEETDS